MDIRALLNPPPVRVSAIKTGNIGKNERGARGMSMFLRGHDGKLTVRLKRQVLPPPDLVPHGRLERGVAFDVAPINHLRCHPVARPAVIGAAQSREVVIQRRRLGSRLGRRGTIDPRGAVPQRRRTTSAANNGTLPVLGVGQLRHPPEVIQLEIPRCPVVDVVRVGDAMMQEVARQRNEYHRADEEEVGLRRGVRLGRALRTGR